MKRFSFLFFFGLAAALAVWSFSTATGPVSSSRMLAVTSTPAAASPTPLPTEGLTSTPTLRPTATTTPQATLAPTKAAPSLPQSTPVLPALGMGEDGIRDPDEPSPVTHVVIPSLGLDAPVRRVPFDGVGWSVTGLGAAVGWLETSAPPGNAGNTVLAGHLTLLSGAEGPFRWLDRLKIGAVVTVFAPGTVYQYRVARLVVVEPGDSRILQGGDTNQLILLTCYQPSWDNAGQAYRQRVAAVAELVSTAPGSHP